MLEDQSRDEGYPNLELDEYFIFLDYRERHWKDFIVEKKY